MYFRRSSLWVAEHRLQRYRNYGNMWHGRLRQLVPNRRDLSEWVYGYLVERRRRLHGLREELMPCRGAPLSAMAAFAAVLAVTCTWIASASLAEAPKDAIPSLPPANAPKPPPVFAGQTSMNGYSLKQFPNFIKNFHFVTVRYRKDTSEMRLTYANDKAWGALLAGGTHYSDGAVFAKIGIMTKQDPAFTSSVVPSGGKRYQLMVMHHKKHAATDGWGYALFDMDGKTFGQDPVEQVAHRSDPCQCRREP